MDNGCQAGRSSKHDEGKAVPDAMEALARYLVALNLPFVIHEPPALREALRRLGKRMMQIAGRNNS